jgi:hypothetical protein
MEIYIITYFQRKFIDPHQEHVALRNHLSLLAVGLHRPLAVHDAAAAASAEVPGLQDHQLEPVVLPSEDAQLSVRDPVVADAGNLQDLQSVPDELHHGGVDLKLPCEEHLRVPVQSSLLEPGFTRDEPTRAVVQLCLEEALPVTTTSLFVDELRVHQEGMPVLNHRGLGPAFGSGGIHHPFAMLPSVQTPLVNPESSIWRKLIVSTPQNFFLGLLRVWRALRGLRLQVRGQLHQLL